VTINEGKHKVKFLGLKKNLEIRVL
jgi:hypothetical protein